MKPKKIINRMINGQLFQKKNNLKYKMINSKKMKVNSKNTTKIKKNKLYKEEKKS